MEFGELTREKLDEMSRYPYASPYEMFSIPSYEQALEAGDLLADDEFRHHHTHSVEDNGVAVGYLQTNATDPRCINAKFRAIPVYGEGPKSDDFIRFVLTGLRQMYPGAIIRLCLRVGNISGIRGLHAYGFTTTGMTERGGLTCEILDLLPDAEIPSPEAMQNS